MINYLSLTLVLSYLVFHNIYAVFIGLTLALLSINSLYIINLKILIERKVKLLKINKDIREKDNKQLKAESNETNSLSLVELIEELGFIPSSNDEDESNVA
tara:strand:+ start:657 stop:959 length:303 start_codon:yes stop_codon:yes gene_type:complete